MFCESFCDHRGRTWRFGLLRPGCEEITAKMLDMARDDPQELADHLADDAKRALWLSTLAVDEAGMSGVSDLELIDFLESGDGANYAVAALCSSLAAIVVLREPERSNLDQIHATVVRAQASLF